MAEEQDLETKAEASANPEKEVRRWLLEIRLASKREKDWREKAKAIFDKYRGKDRKKNSFNILWANTEVLRPALYNSTPKPDVRRRFRQDDMLGKAVAEVAERSVSYCIDAYDLDNCLKNDVLDALLPGRGLSRVRYIPQFKEAAAAPAEEPETNDAQPVADEPSRIKAGFFPAKQAVASAQPEAGSTSEELEYQQALCEHVQWDDYLQGPGKTWDEIPWIAFRCRLTRDDLVEKFGELIGKEIKLNEVSEPELRENKESDLKEVFQRAELWEIWDKDSERVFFVNESYRKGLIYPEGEDGTPPLDLKNFFPCPRPLMLVEDSGTLIPIPLYELYREQAEELDRISGRINKIVNACRVRFVHDPTLTELKALMDADDNTGIPAEQARAWMTNGGIEKAIWWMPIDQIATVLKELYVARDAAKQVIYEITGISDIIRGATDPRETLGAQKLKANSSSLRLQRMQREVQRYVRDLIRLLAEVIGEHFDQQTLAQMTGLQFPTALQKQQAQLLLQAAQQVQQQGQQIPQEAAQKIEFLQEQMKMPSWEDVLGVLQSDMQREYRVDVETDSTVAENLQQDMEGLREVVGGLVEFWQGAGPAVQAGALSIDAVKSISLVIARRARMGLEVEDALEEGFQQPRPQPAEDDNGAAAAAAEKLKIAEQQAVEKGKRAEEDAKREVEFIKKKAELEVREIAVKAKEDAFNQEVRAQQDAMAMRDEHTQRMASLDSRESEMNLKDQAREAMGGLEKQVSIADERGKAAKDLSSASQGNAAALQDAVKELVKAQGHAQKTLDSIAKEVGRKRNRQVTTPDGRKYVSEEM